MTTQIDWLELFAKNAKKSSMQKWMVYAKVYASKTIQGA